MFHPIAFATLLCVSTVALGQDIRHTTKPAPPPDPEKVLVTTYSVDWALRDDAKPSLGCFDTFYSKAAAEERAARCLRNNREAHKDGKAWTWMKYVEITATPELVAKDDPVLNRVRVWRAVEAGLAKNVDKCNYLVQQVAAAAKIDGLAGLTADKMGEYFASDAATKAGWKRLAAGKDETLLEVAGRTAKESLVVGVITSADRNTAKPKTMKEFSNGHVVVVTPGGGTEWADTILASANAGKVKTGRLVPANEITYPWERSKYKFYAIPLPAE